MYRLKFIIIVIAIVFCANSYAQTNHFIYIESQNKEGFFVRFSDKEYTSGSTGFIHISKITPGTYSLFISGISEKTFQKFTVEVGNDDLGFSLKHNGEKKWALFDINRFITISPDAETNAAEPATETKPDEPITKAEAISNKNTVKESTAKPSITPPAEAKPLPVTRIRKIFDKPNSSGLNQIYIDEIGDKSDTVSIYINTFIKADTAKEVKPASKPVVVVNAGDNIDKKVATNCKLIASETDVQKLIAAMRNSTEAADQLDIAIKSIKKKCYSAAQLKTITALLKDEKDKLTFLLTARDATWDIANYPTLESELNDAALKQSFRASIKN